MFYKFNSSLEIQGCEIEFIPLRHLTEHHDGLQEIFFHFSSQNSSLKLKNKQFLLNYEYMNSWESS